jgi:hypothetical protein
MFEALGITDVIDRATQQAPEMRMVTAGHAVKAMVLNGLGFRNQQLSLVPHFFQNKPRARLMAPGMQASHLHDDPLGRALDTLYDFGVTALYDLMAAPAATRLGLTRMFRHRDTTRLHVDGRYHSAQPPDAQVVHIPQGYRRDHRPALNQVMLGHCQVVEAKTRIRREGTPLRSYLLSRRPAPYPLFRPNSRSGSASLCGTPIRTTDAVAVESVGSWGHMLTENAGHALGT